jgi:hypothetical protein
MSVTIKCEKCETHKVIPASRFPELIDMWRKPKKKKKPAPKKEKAAPKKKTFLGKIKDKVKGKK